MRKLYSLKLEKIISIILWEMFSHDTLGKIFPLTSGKIIHETIRKYFPEIGGKKYSNVSRSIFSL